LDINNRFNTTLLKLLSVRRTKKPYSCTTHKLCDWLSACIALQLWLHYVGAVTGLLDFAAKRL